MPIFMDRHDVSEAVTAEMIANLHQQDLKIQGEFECTGLTYWFDEKRRTAFCLIEAPNREAIVAMHAKAHGKVPHEVIEVDPTLVESFLGRIQDPERTSDTGLNIIRDPGFRIIMIISLKQAAPPLSTSNNLQDALSRFRIAVGEIMAQHEGSIVEQTDFRYLASFTYIAKAVQAALAVRENLLKHQTNEVVLKIGISSGMPVTGNKLIFEEAIKSAERISATGKGDIILSHEVVFLYRTENVKGLPVDDSVNFLSHDDEHFINRLMDYIESVWNEASLQVDDFSKTLGLSKSMLYRKMMMLTGKSPHEFVKDYRLEKALQLLMKNKGNVSEIAFETGFSSPSYFTKCFQKKYGFPPSDYLVALAS